jgi:Ca-activated chloride channel family protein
MSTLTVRPETRTLEARAEGEDPRSRLASAWILCDVTAPEPNGPVAPRRPVNVTLVLDRSGSMAGRPLELAKKGAALALDLLRDGDRFGIVAYDDRVRVVTPSAAATAQAREEARQELAELGPGGSTDLHGGWLQGCEEIARGLALAPGADARCLLLTDGLANHGVTDSGEIARQAAELRARGIATSTFGLGDGFDEVLLQRMSEAGGGNAYWARQPEQVGPAMEAELGDSLEVVARDAALVVEGYGVEEVLLPGVGRLQKGEDGRFRHRLGNLAAGQVRSEALHLRLRRRLPSRESGVKVWLEDAEGALPREEREAAWTFRPRAEAVAAPLDSDVVVATRTAFVQGLVLDALRFETWRDTGDLLKGIDREAARLATLARRVPALAPVLDDLRDAAEKLADREFLLDSGRAKEAFYRASYALRGRDAAGRARRGSGGLALDVVLHGDGIDLAETCTLLDARFRSAARGRIPVRVRHGEVFPESAGPGEPLPQYGARQLYDRAFVRKDEQRATLIVTRRPLASNRFSEFVDSPAGVVVSLSGVTDATTAPVEAFLAYETVLHGLRAARAAWDPDMLMHTETRGCVFDLCEIRSDLDVKLHSASLCIACRERLRRSRIDTGLVDTLLSVVRDLSAAGAKKVN